PCIYTLSLHERSSDLDDLKHLSEDFRVAADDAARIDVAGVAAKIPDQAPGLLHEQGACRHVPGRKAHFPESVEPSRGHVGDVERSEEHTSELQSRSDL